MVFSDTIVTYFLILREFLILESCDFFVCEWRHSWGCCEDCVTYVKHLARCRAHDKGLIEI